MPSSVLEFVVLFTAGIPFIFYFLAIYSSGRYFRQSRNHSGKNLDFTPPISNLKPVRGLDPDAYENFASFCRQDYPEYELIFCATDQTDSSVPVIQKLMRDFPERTIRLLYSGGYTAINDKVAKLRLMEREAQHEYLVINDSDVRVDSEYLRRVVEPLRDPKVGGVTCFYVSSREESFAEKLQTIGMISDFYAGVLVAWQLDGVHFALGPTMVSTKQRVRAFGGFQVLENRPADDLLFGRLIAEQGVEMIAVLVHPTLPVVAAYWGSYLVFRVAMTWLIGIQGLKQAGLWTKMPLIPLWDAMAFLIWLVSFTRTSIRWRNVDYQLRNGQFVATTDALVPNSSSKSDS